MADTAHRYRLHLWSSVAALAAGLPTGAMAQRAADVPAAPTTVSPQPDAGVGPSADGKPAIVAGPAAGAPVDPGEIVVTATRTAQASSRVPISLSAYNQASLDRTGVRDVSGIVNQTPGLVFEQTRNSTNISIRGINSVAGAATTGIYIDDVPIQIRSLGYGGGNAYPAVFDLERVEVLRGPQGTLFGAGSEGGTVRFITPKPSLSRYSGYSRAEVGTTEGGAASYEVGTAVGGPIVEDKLGFRISGYYRRDGGYVDRVPYGTTDVDKNSNWQNSYVGRAALTLAPVETVTITPAVFFQKQYQHDSSYYWEKRSDPGDGKFVNANPVQEFTRDRFVLPSLNIEADLGAANLYAVGSYLDRRQNVQLDYTTFNQDLFTGFPYPTLPGQNSPATFVNTQKNWTGEVRLQSADSEARLRWLIGGFFADARQSAVQRVQDTFFPTYIQARFGVPYTLVFGQPLVDGLYIYDQVSTTRDLQYAAFGELNFKLFERLTLTAGLRYGTTKFTIDANAGGPVVGPRAIDHGSQTEHPLTPKFGVNFQANRDNLFYFTAAKGFRPGGYNPAVGLPCGPQLAGFGLADRPPLYNSDSVWSYEVGAKNKLFNRALSIEASAYQVDWNNIQNVVNLNSCGFRFVSNQGSVRSRGFDLSASLTAIPHLSLSTAIGYTHARFRDTVVAGPAAATNVVTQGDAVSSPPWTVAVHAEYARELWLSKEGYLRADYNYRSHQNAITPTLDPRNGGSDLTIANIPSANLLALRAGLRFGGVDASVFVNNLTNETGYLARQRDNTRQIFYRDQTYRPRTYGLTVAYRF